MEYGIYLFTPQISLHQLKESVSYVIIPSKARFINLSHTQHASRALVAQQGRNSNISIDLLGVGSWRHPVLTSGCILGLPGNATSSANQILWGTIMFYSNLSAFHFGFLPSKPCFSRKSVPLNSCYTGANQQWIGSFPADQWDRLVESKAGFSSIHPSTVELESELRLKFKLIFVKCIFEFI